MKMSIELSKSKKILFIIALMFTTIAYMGEMAMLPFVYNLYQEFPESVGAVNYIITGPAIIMVAASLLATAMLSKFSKKFVLSIGVTVFAISSVFGVALVNTTYMIIMRTFMGVGEGFVNVSVMALIAEIFIDENERASFMGYYNAALTVAGAAMTYVAGVLAVSAWQNAYKTFWPSILMVIAVILFVPNMKNVDTGETESKDTSKKQPFGFMYWIFIFDYVIFTFLYGLTAIYTSYYVAENGLGTSAFAGTCTALASIGGFFLCLVFGKIYGKFKKATAIPCIIAAVTGLALMYFMPSRTTAIIGSLLVGTSYGIYFAYSYAFASEIVPASRVDKAIGVTTAIYASAFFVLSYVVTWLMDVMQTGFMVTPIFKVFMFLGIIPLIVEVVTLNKYKKSITKVN